MTSLYLPSGGGGTRGGICSRRGAIPAARKQKRPLHHRISANRNRTRYDLNTTNNVPNTSLLFGVRRVL